MLNILPVEESSLLEEEVVTMSCTAAMTEVLVLPEVYTWECMVLVEVEDSSYTAMERNVIGDVK